jgi:hypothetical protein
MDIESGIFPFCPACRGEPSWRETAGNMVTDRAGKKYSPSMLAPPIDTSDRLAKISGFYHREAERCAGNRAYCSACVLAAAALEAILLSYCYVEDRQVRTTEMFKRKKSRSKRNRFLEFNLFQLISIAAELKWIPSKEIKVNGRKGTLQILLQSIKNTRNMVHPGVWAKEGGPGYTEVGMPRFLISLTLRASGCSNGSTCGFANTCTVKGF